MVSKVGDGMPGVRPAPGHSGMPNIRPPPRDEKFPPPHCLNDPNNIFMKTISPGDGRSFPRDHNELRIFYKGWLHANNELFDETDEEYPILLNSGANITGLEIALKRMTVGQVSKVFIPSGLAYGAYGAPGLIPPNSALVFELRLLRVLNR